MVVVVAEIRLEVTDKEIDYEVVDGAEPGDPDN